jgi:hypothetical protein
MFLINIAAREMSVYKKDAEYSLVGNRKVFMRRSKKKKFKHFLGSSLIIVLFPRKMNAVSY